ncbi:PhzF family phenazine biosynthesis protein [Lacibacterium aquatile]|uniref:PhzF family phenazine biosynthesis protein n=1 Tax=Lacibacterium aquatile TaxID=1168082 RepID=A0ABW5DLV4_9PROT
MQLPIYKLDAFANTAFSGNPAAVCPLESWLPPSAMQAIAAENNLSETAFIHRRPDRDYDIRWFRPSSEVDLCGHATLASGKLVLDVLERGRCTVVFHSKSGPLTVERTKDGFALNFPIRKPRQIPITNEIVAALGAEPMELLEADRWLAVYPDADAVRRLKPDMAAVARFPVRGIGVTAPGDCGKVDFVSRYFAPRVAVPEDPVTGALHCVLAPYWGARLYPRTAFTARQVSRRGGDLKVALQGERVRLEGQAVLTMAGSLSL